VELRSDLRESENAIVAVLAHEIAHIFLYREGIRLIPTFHNEVLTDTTAAFLGCGLTILNGWTVRKSILGNSIETQWNHFGYLSLDEFGYVQAKRDAFFDSSPVHRFQYALPQSGFREGQRRLKMELRKRPFVRPFIFKRVGMALAVFIRKGRRLEEPKSLTFPCAICSQSLRIPLLGSRMSVHCPTCGTTLLCYS